MARIKKFGDTRTEKLTTFQTFLIDENPNSTYFRISEFKDTFTGGKNGFLIEGSEFLKETTEIKIEVLDVNGNPLYYEPGDGIPEYYEGISKVVAVYVYEDTPIGLGKITVLGELKTYLDDGGVVRNVPDEWNGVYNVKWEKEFKINKLLPNEDKVRFYKRPKITIDEIARPIFTTVPIVVEQSGFVNGTPLIPTEGSSLTNFTLPTEYLLTIVDNTNWTSSVIGNPIILPELGVSLQPSDIITNKQLTVSTPYAVNGIVTSFFNQPYTASFNYLETDTAIGTALSGSFGKIKITDLATFVGDVARVKVFRKSQSEVSDYQFIQEIALESNEILIDLESSQRTQENYGLFTPFVIDNYWISSSNNLTTEFNQTFLYNSVKLNSSGINKFYTSKDLEITEGIEYTLSFNIRLEQNISVDNYISVYLEGSLDGRTVRQDIGKILSSNPILQKTNIVQNIIANKFDDVKLYFEINGNGWYISDVSLRASQETSFSPDEITFIQPIPRTLETETFDFRFDFFDINNNYIPIEVFATKTFNGGNLNRINKSLTITPSSLYFQFDSGSGVGNPLPPTAIFLDIERNFLTGSINFVSKSFDINNNEISASEYIGGQYPGLLEEVDTDLYRLTVENFTGSRDDIIVQYIQYVAETEGVSDNVVITRVSDGKGGVNYEIRPYRGTVIRNKDQDTTLEIQAIRIDGINEINLVSGLPLNKSDVKLFVQSGSVYRTITEASQSGFLKGVIAGTTGSTELDYNAVFNRDSINGQLTIYLIPSSSQNRDVDILTSLTVTDILDGLDAGFIEYDVDAFTINPRTETVFTPTFSNVTASYYRRGTTENPISASVMVYPSMSINEDFTPQYWLRYQTGSVNTDIIISGFDESGNELFSQLSSSFIGNVTEQNKQLTLSFNYIEPYTSESVLVDHTFSVIPEGLPGKDAIVYEITPNNVVLNADPNGTVFDYSPSITEIKVKQGFDYLTFTGSKKPGTFFLEQNNIIGTGLTPGFLYSSSLFTQSVFISESSDFNLLSGSVDYTIDVYPFFTSSFFTQTLTQPYLKVLEGDNARSVTLRASSNIVNYNGDGNVISPEGDIELTATAFGVTGSVYYQFFRNGIPFSTRQLSNIFEVGSGDAASIGETVLWSVQIRDGAPTSEVRAEGSVTIAGVQGGADSYNVQLTNENSSVVQSVFGITTLNGTGTDILVSKGSIQLEAVTTYPFPQFDQLGNEIPNGKYITTIHSKPSHITLAGNLVSGSVVPVVGGIASIGDILVWDSPETNPIAQIVYRIDVEDGRSSFLKTQNISVQFEGDTGPGIVFRGEWTGSIPYIYDISVRRRDAVLRNVDGGTHYWATTEGLVTSSVQPFTQQPIYPATAGEIDAGGWEYLGEEDLFVAAKIAIFEESFVKNTINVGNNPDSAFANIVIAGGRIDPYFAIGQNGTVGVSGDQTSGGVIGYNRPGIFMGTFDSSGNKTPRFSLVNGTQDRFLRWDGQSLDIQGSINITGGQAQTDITNSFASASNALLNAQISGSNALDAARASGSVDPVNQRITKPATPSGNGLFLGSNNLGYYADGSWKTYMASNGDFFLTGSNNNFLQWNSSTGVLNIAGSINITGGQAQTDINNSFASASFALNNARLSGSVDPVNQRITKPATPSGAGLYLGSNNLGYYSGSGWKTYMASNGDFFLTGNQGGLTWNSLNSKLVISGSIDAFDGNIGNWIIEPVSNGGNLRNEDNTIILNPSSPIPQLEFYSGSGDGRELKLVVKPEDKFTDPSAGNISITDLPSDVNSILASVSLTSDTTVVSTTVDTTTTTSYTIPSNGVYTLTGLTKPSASLPQLSEISDSIPFPPNRNGFSDGETVYPIISGYSINATLSIVAKNTNTNIETVVSLSTVQAIGGTRADGWIWDAGISTWMSAPTIVQPSLNPLSQFQTPISVSMNLVGGNYVFFYRVVINVTAGLSQYDEPNVSETYYPITFDGSDLIYKNSSGGTTNYLSSTSTIIVPTNIVELTSSGLQITSRSSTFVKIQRTPLSISSGAPILMETLGGRIKIGESVDSWSGGGTDPSFVSLDNLGRTSTKFLTILGDGSLATAITISNIATGTGDALHRTSTGNVVRNTSSKRYKLNIEDLNKSIVDNVIQNLRPVWYRANPETTVDRTDWSYIGFIAEEVAEIEPRLVNYSQTVDINGKEVLIPSSVQYDRVSVILLSHIQSQSKVIDNLINRIEQLEEYISGSINL